MYYKTVYDLIGKFHETTRIIAGDPSPKHKNRDIVLAKGLTVQMAALGRSVHEVSAKKIAKQHFLTTGLTRRWMYDFELRERRVYDKPGEPEEAQAQVA